jgi:propanol-preferring alcohol dehydrogenase
MYAMQLDRVRQPLRRVERATPALGANDLLIEVAVCGVCRTDLHVVDGDLHGPLPIIPGHEIVGRVAARGTAVGAIAIGDRVGVPWLAGTCGVCPYCMAGRENLCDAPRFTGFTRDGGYASHVVADARYCVPLPERFADEEAAPLLCAGLIGWRSLAMTGGAHRLGLYGFGAAAHITAQVARHQGREVHAFTRRGDGAAQALARSLGCATAGPSDDPPPVELDAAIIFAPVGALVPAALRATRKGGTVVCGGIHMSDIPSFPYELLWGERVVRSVANLTRADSRAFFSAIADMPLRIEATAFPLTKANEALACLKSGGLTGAAVLVP